MTFVQRKIDLEFQLGIGAFGEDGSTDLKVSGLRVQAHIIKAGGETLGECHLRVYGLTADMMAALTSLSGYDMVQRANSVIVTAGDGASGMSTVFEGTIAEGWADLNTAPDTALNVTAYAGLLPKLKPVDATSYPGPVDVAVVMSNLAKQMGLGFESNGVSVTLPKMVFPGTAWEQARSCAEAAGINWTIDRGVLAIWSATGSRAGSIPLVSPSTGMVGYPAYTGYGVAITTELNPSIQVGGLVNVESSILIASKQFYVTDVSYELQSETPGGEWFTKFNGRINY